MAALRHRHRRPPALRDLLVGLPYDIYCDRDLQLHGRTVEATAVSERQVKFRDNNYHRMVTFAYRVDGDDCTLELTLDAPALGGKVRLRYAPVSPAHAVLDDAQLQPWDQGLIGRLAISWTLGSIFLLTWVSAVFAKRG